MSHQPSLHNALTSLLPTLQPLPPLLILTAENLYTLSRHRAIHLQPSEEIARAHVCAELACRRLRVTLRLPRVRSGAGAPCKPAVYRRLLGFLEGLLRDSESSPEKKVGTASRNESQSQSAVKRAREDREREVDGTPSKRQKTISTPIKPGAAAGNTANTTATTTTTSTAAPAAAKRHPTSFLGRLAASNPQNTRDLPGEAPAYILPAIKKICQAWRTEKLVLHVYTGVCVMLGLAGLWPPTAPASASASASASAATDTGAATSSTATATESANQDSILALTVSIYLLTLTRMQTGSMTTPLFEAICKRSFEILDFSSSSSSSSTPRSRPNAINAETKSRKNETRVRGAIEAWIGRVNENQWTEDGGKGEDWWDSVPEGVVGVPSTKTILGGNSTRKEDIDTDIHVHTNGEDRGERVTNEEDRRARAERRKEALERQIAVIEGDTDSVLLPGLGTMVNDAVDFGGVDRRARFEEWRSGMLVVIQRLEGAGGSGGGRRKVKMAGTGGVRTKRREELMV